MRTFYIDEIEHRGLHGAGNIRQHVSDLIAMQNMSGVQLLNRFVLSTCDLLTERSNIQSQTLISVNTFC